MPREQSHSQGLCTAAAQGNRLLAPDLTQKLWDLLSTADTVVAKRDSANPGDTAYAELNQALATVGPVAAAVRRLREADDELQGVTELTMDPDPEMREAAFEGLAPAVDMVRQCEQDVIDTLLAPSSAHSGGGGGGGGGSAILEIRAGAGGREAALFTLDLWRMYEACVKRQGWRAEAVQVVHNPDGGARTVSANITGHEAFGFLRHETGVHRVQRVPTTETQGRVHTSTAVVVILPEPTKHELPDVDAKDIKVDTFRAGGAGGQHVNTTDSAVRLTHLPTGVTVECQSERSQHQNRAQALKTLRARVYAVLQERALAEQRAARDEISGSLTGDRSERIRTYNTPQDRVTDHRTGESTSAAAMLTGVALDEIVQTLQHEAQLETLVGTVDALLTKIRALGEAES